MGTYWELFPYLPSLNLQQFWILYPFRLPSDSQITSFDRFDGLTSTAQDKLFKGYDMEIHNQIFYTTLCSCFLSFTCEFVVVIKEFIHLILLCTFFSLSILIKLAFIQGLSMDIFSSNHLLSFLFVVIIIITLGSIVFRNLPFDVGLTFAQGNLLQAIDFVYRHNDCFFDIVVLSSVS